MPLCLFNSEDFPLFHVSKLSFSIALFPFSFKSIISSIPENPSPPTLLHSRKCSSLLLYDKSLGKVLYICCLQHFSFQPFTNLPQAGPHSSTITTANSFQIAAPSGQISSLFIHPAIADTDHPFPLQTPSSHGLQNTLNSSTSPSPPLSLPFLFFSRASSCCKPPRLGPLIFSHPLPWQSSLDDLNTICSQNAQIAIFRPIHFT